MTSKTIHPTELKALMTRGQPIDLLDVRTPGEHRAVHVSGVRLMPLDELDPGLVQRMRPSDAVGPTYVLCKAGSRARQAAQRLTAAGLDVVVVDGGTDACVKAGLAVIRGKAGLPLHRQALLGAGLVVWSGLVLSWFVHPWFIGLAAFAGCGLMLAGLADICLMAIVLGKMPWNRTSRPGKTDSNATVDCCSMKGAAS